MDALKVMFIMFALGYIFWSAVIGIIWAQMIRVPGDSDRFYKSLVFTNIGLTFLVVVFFFQVLFT